MKFIIVIAIFIIFIIYLILRKKRHEHSWETIEKGFCAMKTRRYNEKEWSEPEKAVWYIQRCSNSPCKQERAFIDTGTEKLSRDPLYIRMIYRSPVENEKD